MKRTTLLPFLLPLLALMLAASLAPAATYYVATSGNDGNPGTQAQPFLGIQKGLDTAADGDTIIVAAGTYTSLVLRLSNKSLTLQGAGAGQSIINHLPGNDGGCLNLSFSPASRIDGFTFQNGRKFSGAGLSNFFSHPRVSNCIFRDNTATANNTDNGRGGGMNNARSNPTVINCTFLNNSATEGGGMASDNKSSPTVINCIYDGNFTSGTGGGGIYQAGASSTITNCTFRNNRTKINSWRGGGAWIQAGSAKITNCLFANNTASGGGGLSITAAGTTVTNCTFVNNASYNTSGQPAFGGGLANEFSSNTVANCIFRGNIGGEIYNASGTAAVTYSNVQGGYAGAGNINADPNFVNAAAANYRLQATSPSRDTGSAAVADLPATDFDGAPRILGSAPDMGPYEFWSSSSGAWFVDIAIGNDTAGTGAPAAPYRTVVKAIATASASHRIYIRQGNYGSDRPRITKALKFYNWGSTGRASLGKP